METGILVQSMEIAASLALGVCLGFLYDIFRVARNLFRAIAFLFDLGFCFVLAVGLFVLGMACGGTLRFYMPFAAALGAAVYSALFGRWLRRVFARMERFARGKLETLKSAAKKMNKNLKNIFSRLEKRFRITKYTKDKTVGKSRSNTGARKARRKGENDEISTDGHTCKTYYPGDFGVCDIHDSRGPRASLAGRRAAPPAYGAGGERTPRE